MLDTLLITGAAGTGKTSTAEAWAASRSERAAHLSHDAIMGFVKSGMVSPAESTGSEAERQWDLARAIMLAATRLYHQAGIRCVIDTFCLPEHLVRWQALSDLRVGIVVLHPPLAIALERNQQRLADTGWGVEAWQVEANHNAMQAWQTNPEVLLLDNSQLCIAEVLAAIDAWERTRGW